MLNSIRLFSTIFVTFLMAFGMSSSTLADLPKEPGPERQPLLQDAFKTILKCQIKGSLGYIQLNMAKDLGEYIFATKFSRDFKTSKALFSMLDRVHLLELITFKSVKVTYDGQSGLLSIVIPTVLLETQLVETSQGEWEMREPGFYVGPAETTPIKCEVTNVYHIE